MDARGKQLKLILFLALLCGLIYATHSQQTQRTRSSLAPKIRNLATNNNSPTSAVPNSSPVASNSTNTQNPNHKINQQLARTRSANQPAKRNQNDKPEFLEDELPADFYEMPPEQLDLGMNATGRAPVPILNVAVLQNGQVIDSAINVHPGTPLEMVIYLDDKSAKVYGLLASYLKVTDDTFRQREEIIISNGCSIDTYIFGNFELNPEDQSLRAKFRAFKFPDSNFVRFVGTVNVCIKQCARVNCEGTRRKRSSEPAGGINKRLVLTVSTVLRIGDATSSEQTQLIG